MFSVCCNCVFAVSVFALACSEFCKPKRYVLKLQTVFKQCLQQIVFFMPRVFVQTKRQDAEKGKKRLLDAR